MYSLLLRFRLLRVDRVCTARIIDRPGDGERGEIMARRRLMLEGPAAAAVERLAERAGISPAELIKRALSREDEAQRADPDLVGDALTPTGLSVTDS